MTRHALTTAQRHLGLTIIVGLVACIPVQWQTGNHLVATGWSNGGEPVALAQRFRVSAEAYLLSPEGPGMFRHASRGSLVLIEAGKERDIRLGPPGAAIDLWEAHYLPGKDAFFVVRGVTSKDDPDRGTSGCLLVGLDGGVRDCGLPPGIAYGGAPQGLSSDGLRVRNRRFRDGVLSFDEVNLETGQVSKVEDFILTLPVRASNEAKGDSAPCDMSRSRLSPRETRVAAACPVRSGAVWRRGLWLFESGKPPRLLFDFDSAPGDPAEHGLRVGGPADGDDPPEEMVTAYDEGYGLAWSPDERFVYWCNGRGKGLLVFLSGEPPITDAPCLTLATVSPDGRKVFGVDHRFEPSVWTLPAR